MIGSPSGLIGGKIDTIVSTLRHSHFGDLRVVGFFSSDSRPHALVQPLIAAIVARGERVAHICPAADAIAMAGCLTEPLTDRRGNLRPTEVLVERIAHLVREHHRIIVDLHGDFPVPDTARVLSVCDEIFGLVDSGCQQQSQRVCRDLSATSPELAPRIRTVWVLRSPELVTPSSKASSAVGNHNFVVQLADSPRHPTQLQQQGIDRIVRHLRGIRLGLALGGGAARGMAHLGVLKAFNRAGISFDMVAGTSAGAMVGIPYAAGYEPEVAIQHYTDDLTAPRPYRWLPGGLQWYLLVKYRTGSWDRMLRKYFFDWKLNQLQVPMYTVAVDLVSGRQIVRDRGDAVHALAESINLPVLSRPICRDGMALVDGGVLNTLPTQVLADRGADLVVGVSVSGKIRHEFSGNRTGMETSTMRRPGTLQTLRRVLETQDHALKAIDAQAADLLIEPDATSFDMADFSRTPEIAAVGEAAAEQAIGHLEKMIADLERRAMQQIGLATLPPANV